MNINEYLAHIETVIHSSSIVTSYHLNIDRKTEDIAFLSGGIEFRDGSTVDFKEFVERKEAGIEKYKYGYNYRKGSDVIFRYDNAFDPRAKELPSFPHHKHTKSGEILTSKPIELSEVLEEIEDILLETWKI